MICGLWLQQMSIWVKPLTDNRITGSPEIWPKFLAFIDLQNTNHKKKECNLDKYLAFLLYCYFGRNLFVDFVSLQDKAANNVLEGNAVPEIWQGSRWPVWGLHGFTSLSFSSKNPLSPPYPSLAPFSRAWVTRVNRNLDIWGWASRVWLARRPLRDLSNIKFRDAPKLDLYLLRHMQ